MTDLDGAWEGNSKAPFVDARDASTRYRRRPKHLLACSDHWAVEIGMAAHTAGGEACAPTK